MYINLKSDFAVFNVDLHSFLKMHNVVSAFMLPSCCVKVNLKASAKVASD